MSKHHGFCFTLNNYTVDEEERVKALDADYLVYGREEGEEEHTPHLQGYVYWKQPRRFLAAKAAIGDRAHVEAARGTGEENRAYCTKQGVAFEKGVCPQDKRKNLRGPEVWKQAIVAAQQGQFDEIPADMYTRFYTTYHRIRTAFALRDKADELAEPCGLWYYGPPRTGKSYAARRVCADFYTKPPNKWFDGYAGEYAVIIDDLDPDHSKYLAYYIKLWADVYPFTAEIKGGTIRCRPEKIIITSNYKIEECFSGVDLDAIKERFKCVHFGVVYKK